MVLTKTLMNLVYIRKSKKGKVAFLVLYVDDILFIGNDVGYLTEVKNWHGVHLSKEQCPKTHQEVEDMRCILYVSIVDSLMYVMLYTRLDICYAVGIVSRYQSNPRLDHWKTVKIILKYLKRMRDYMFAYGAKDLILIRYMNSDFQTDKDSRKSTSGSVFNLNREL
ncbi:gag/pol protein [Cucumis melo var. makuwa]|uniref:Gag/pol protein n=1 Tax=Cucumis melo var. makuwa TaxID=1194695 RepID=A0A5A7VGF4_CUCMM|nr:gag/pol protein [Cucumis melo var. makuwa]